MVTVAPNEEKQQLNPLMMGPCAVNEVCLQSPSDGQKWHPPVIKCPSSG